MSGQSYSAELRIVERELKRLNGEVREKRETKKVLQRKLHEYMVRHRLTEIEGYTLEKLKPPAPKAPKPKEKPKRAKKRDAVEYFKRLGIRNPEICYQEFLETQRPNDEDEGEDRGES